MKLYIYDHCPYCVRVRMIFGLKSLPVQLCILPGNDEATPVSMIGKKMVPILQKDDGSYMAESMDIVRYVDHLDGRPLLSERSNPQIIQWIDRVKQGINPFLLSCIEQAPFAEFTGKQARTDFIQKKAIKFDYSLEQRTAWIRQLNDDFQDLALLLATQTAPSYDDIQLFPLLRNLCLISGTPATQEIVTYMHNMSQRTCINLLH